MRVRYIGSGDPTDSATCEVFGLSFPLDEWVPVNDAALAKRLGTNPVFEAEGAASTASEAPDEVDIPQDWASLPWPQRRSIASKLSKKPIRDADDAARAISLELARREG